jgi:invasion protein IalB
LPVELPPPRRYEADSPRRDDIVTSKASKSVRAMAALIAVGLWAGVPTGRAQQAENPDAQARAFGPRAKPAAQQPPDAEVVGTEGNWKIQCEKGGSASGDGAQEQAQKTCGLVQSARSDKNPKAGMTLIVVKTKQGDKTAVTMRIMAPIGVFLPTGVALEIDGAAVGRVPFTRCLPQVCIAFAEAQPATLDKFKKGTAANFIIYEGPGQGLPMKITLSGFSKALAALDKL